MQTVTVEPEKLYTKTEYAKAYRISLPTINKKIETKEIRSLKIKGATIIIAA